MPKRLALAHDTTPLARSTERPVARPGPDGALVEAIDHVVVEEPLEIRLGGEAIAVTMRTPGDDFELAAGFLFTETAIRSNADIARIAFSQRAEDKERRNVVEVTPAAGVVVDADKAKRSFYAASSCGLCGKATLDAIEVKVARLGRKDDGTVFPVEVLRGLPDAMRAAQRTFASTGGLHAAALFDATGALIVVREDIGRHNATDKVIGHRLIAGATPCRGQALLVSGRAGFEIVQKAAVARIPLVAAVSAPSSLAIDLAQRLGITLVAFLRPPSAGIYSHPWRVLA